MPVIELSVITVRLLFFTHYFEERDHVVKVISIVLEAACSLRTTTLSVLFAIAIFRMQQEIRSSYRWLMTNLMWRILTIGGALTVSLIGTTLINFISLYATLKHEYILDDTDKTATILHNIEAGANILACITVLLAYPARDMFDEFNKYPELIKRVSIM